MTLRTIQNNKIVRLLAGTISFYIVSFMIIAILEKQNPGGPCAPGLGMLGFFLLVPISVVLFFINLYKTVKEDKTYLYSVLVHVLVWAGIYFWL